MSEIFSKLREQLNNLEITDHVKDYFSSVIDYVERAYKVALEARQRLLDPENKPESILVWDMADRIEAMVGPRGISSFIRENIRLPREVLALKAIEKILDDYLGIYPTEELANLCIRLALAILTEGMTVAPTEGIQKVKIKKDPQGPYLSIYFAGPIRAAGGTEAGLILVYADYVRRRLGLARYTPRRRPGEDEVQRFIEELRLYEREVGRFQMKCTNAQIEYALTNLPIEVTGPATNEIEVLVNRDLPRIETNKLRGGALRVINDGLIGRARKIAAVVEKLGIDGWDWLHNLSKMGAEVTAENEETISDKVAEDVIMGRPVISLKSQLSSFRVRYGRESNMGISAVGVHPAVFPLLKYFLVIGSQIKIDYPGKGAIVVPSSLAEPPIVELDNGDVIRVTHIELAEKIVDKIKRILWLGDLVISYGDVLENNRELLPSPYVIEWWLQDVYDSLSKKSEISGDTKEGILNVVSRICNDEYVSINDAISISKILDIPLCPIFTIRWKRISLQELIELLDNIEVICIHYNKKSVEIRYDLKIKRILTKLLIPHIVANDRITLEYPASEILLYLSERYNELKPIRSSDVLDVREFLVKLLSVEVRDIDGSRISVRLGRPEKASMRKLKPPVHVLFPVGSYGGPSRDIIKVYNEFHRISIELSVRVCPNCGAVTPYRYCSKCGVKTIQYYYCKSCKRIYEKKVCPRCGIRTVPYREYTIDVKSFFNNYFASLKPLPKKLKGVRKLMNKNRIPEYLPKGILRSIYGLSIFKDGTIRIDITNAPLLEFRIRDIYTDVNKLRKLGYKIESNDQWIPLYPQDIIIPKSVANDLVRITKFVDELLVRIYDFKKGFYNINSINDLIGHLVVGLSPHTSAGVIGRIIGFTDAQVLYAHPLWHAAKRRDCDGDQDSIILLLDVLLNFSKHYLPSGSGGRMDAPLYINVVLLPEEVDTQPHNMDVVSKYPKILYESSLNYTSSKDIRSYVKTIEEFLWTKNRYGPFPSTFHPPMLQLSVNKSTYSRLGSMKRKVDEQIKLMSLLFDDEIKGKLIESILNKHILPDILGNLRAYQTQMYKCKKCGTVYRRPPLRGVCDKCGSELNESIHSKSVVKYLPIARDLISQFKVDNYLKRRIELLEREIEHSIEIRELRYKKLTSYLRREQ